VSRILGPSQLGRVSFANSVVFYLLLFANAGLPFYGTREIARYRDDKEKTKGIVLELFIISIAFTIIALTILLSLIAIIPKFREEKWTLLIFSSMLLFNSFGMEWFFQGKEKYIYITIRSLLVQFVALSCLFLFVHRQNDIYTYTALVAFASVGSNVFNIVYIIRDMHGVRTEILSPLRHIKSVFTMFGLDLAVGLYTNLNIVLLGFWGGTKAVGYYTIAVKLISVVQSIVSSFSRVLLPRNSYYFEKMRYDEFWLLIRKAIKYLLALGLPCIIGLTFLRKEIVEVFAGPDFFNSGNVLGILTLNILLVGLNGIFGVQILIPVRKEKSTLRSCIFGSLINIGLNILLLPVYREIGAAISAVVTELMIFVYQLFACKKYWPLVRIKAKEILPYVYGNLMIILVCLSCKYLIASMIIRIITSVSMSMLSYMICLYFTKDEIMMSVLSFRRKVKSKLEDGKET
jgi:O-antigen/teichoic acid export membrane protein